MSASRYSLTGVPFKSIWGMKVKHALIAFDQEIYAEAMDGRIVVEDSRGFRVGLDGALADGARIATRLAASLDNRSDRTFAEAMSIRKCPQRA
jgi:hypothetical protein